MLSILISLNPWHITIFEQEIKMSIFTGNMYYFIRCVIHAECNIYKCV